MCGDAASAVAQEGAFVGRTALRPRFYVGLKALQYLMQALHLRCYKRLGLSGMWEELFVQGVVVSVVVKYLE